MSLSWRVANPSGAAPGATEHQVVFFAEYGGNAAGDAQTIRRTLRDGGSHGRRAAFTGSAMTVIPVGHTAPPVRPGDELPPEPSYASGKEPSWDHKAWSAGPYEPGAHPHQEVRRVAEGLGSRRPPADRGLVRGARLPLCDGLALRLHRFQEPIAAPGGVGRGAGTFRLMTSSAPRATSEAVNSEAAQARSRRARPSATSGRGSHPQSMGGDRGRRSSGTGPRSSSRPVGCSRPSPPAPGGPAVRRPGAPGPTRSSRAPRRPGAASTRAPVRPPAAALGVHGPLHPTVTPARAPTVCI